MWVFMQTAITASGSELRVILGAAVQYVGFGLVQYVDTKDISCQRQ